MLNVRGILNDWSRSLIFPFPHIEKEVAEVDRFLHCENSTWNLNFEEIEVFPA